MSLLSLLVASPVLAATFSAGQTYTLDKEEVINDDLYAAGGSPIVSGQILGDTILAGGNVTFNGTSKANLMAAGGTLTLIGPVGSSVRAAGGTITISAPVGADVVAVGGTITIASTVGRDVALAGGDINIGGTVGRDVTVRGGNVTINGTINGNVDIQAGKVTLGSNAVIKGDLKYSAHKELTKDPAAVVTGQTTFTEIKDNSGSAAGVLAGIFALFFIIKLIAYGAAVIIATTMFNRVSAMMVEASMDDFWKNLCIGFGAVILTPIAFIILLISVIGSIPAFILLALFAILLILAKVIAAVLAGAFLSKWYKKEAVISWKWGLLGLLAITLMAFIPIIGWVGVAVLYFAALGTLASLTYYAIADSR